MLNKQMLNKLIDEKNLLLGIKEDDDLKNFDIVHKAE